MSEATANINVDDDMEGVDEDLFCTICQGNDGDHAHVNVITPCNHVFHRICLDAWISRYSNDLEPARGEYDHPPRLEDTKCPQCNQRFSDIDIVGQDPNVPMYAALYYEPDVNGVPSIAHIDFQMAIFKNGVPAMEVPRIIPNPSPQPSVLSARHQNPQLHRPLPPIPQQLQRPLPPIPQRAAPQTSALTTPEARCRICIERGAKKINLVWLAGLCQSHWKQEEYKKENGGKSRRESNDIARKVSSVAKCQAENYNAQRAHVQMIEDAARIRNKVIAKKPVLKRRSVAAYALSDSMLANIDVSVAVPEEELPVL